MINVAHIDHIESSSFLIDKCIKNIIKVKQKQVPLPPPMLKKLWQRLTITTANRNVSRANHAFIINVGHFITNHVSLKYSVSLIVVICWNSRQVLTEVGAAALVHSPAGQTWQAEISVDWESGLYSPAAQGLLFNPSHQPPGGQMPSGGVGEVLPTVQTNPLSHGWQYVERGGDQVPAGHSCLETSTNKGITHSQLVQLDKTLKS